MRGAAVYDRAVRRAKEVIQPPVPRDASRLESDVVKELRDARSQVWKHLARELQKATPVEPDFGQFGRFRKPDR